MEITGKLIFKKEDSGTTKTGKAWNKLTFAIDIEDDKFDRKLAFQAFRVEVISVVNTANIGSVLKIQYDVSSNEYNGKYYTNATAWAVDLVGSENSNSNNNEEGSDLPF